MDDLFKSSQADASATNVNSENVPSLEAGLAALKGKDYPTAIALLQSVAQTTTDKPTATKAQMSLVMAYERSGNLAQAIVLSQRLSRSSNRQVRLWAIRMEDELARRQEEPGLSSEVSSEPLAEPIEVDDETGFTPINTSIQSDAQTTLQTDEELTAEDDATGFVPLNAGSSVRNTIDLPPIHPRTSPQDESGFVPSIEESSPGEGEVPLAASGDATDPLHNPSDVNLSLPAATPVQSQPSTLENALPGDTQVPPEAAIAPNDSSQAVTPHERIWRQAGRASKWGSLGSVDVAKLWAVEAATVVVLVLVVRALLQVAIALLNGAFVQFRWMIDLRQYTIFADPFWFVVLVLGLLFIASPWLMDSILRVSYRARPFKLDELAVSSPEAVRVLKRICNQRRYPLPSLRVLPIAAPVALTYGFLPQNIRIVLSRGLLQQLSDDEIAAVVIGEVGHVTYWDVGVTAWVALMAQLPYQLYWMVATWGNNQRNGLLKAIAVGVSSFAYGLFWVLRWTGLWLSRLRLYYSDRAASEMTGNPNGLTRALLKIAIGVTEEIQRQGSTGALLQSLDFLTPVGYQTALTLGSTYPYSSFEHLLLWDRINPYRHWLAINNSHPPMGDRLQQLTNYARHWRLATELDFDASSSSNPRASRQAKRFWIQSAPFVGMLIGLLIAACFWLLGAIAAQVGWIELIWMSGDRSILWGFLLSGFSIGTILRINTFFPDIKPSTLQVEPVLPELLTAPYALPTDSQPVRMQGTLLGRPGIGNILTQDLILHTPSGFIRLHYMPLLGPIGHLLPQAIRPSQCVKSPVTITGWFRRGATPWIDVETLQPQRGAKLQAAHPLWSTLLAFATGFLGAYIIFQGGS
ncbi:MAG: M48 family metalloprotease [Oculatellaceae cyanobacterium bins.114]|nr:M48 family metalloprotease [Oculatellaceae cyanobacterium bins.114]